MARPDQLFRRLLEDLRRQIEDSFAPGEKLPSQRLLAEMHGAGQATVTRAMAALAREGLVLSRPRVGWARTARQDMPKKRAFRCGLITRRSEREFAAHLLYGALRAEAQRRGVDLIVCPNPRAHHPTPGRNRLELARVPWNRFEVCFLVEVEDARTLADSLLRARRVLAVDQDATEFGLDSVCFDDTAAGRLAAQHLLSLGHRRLAVADEVNAVGWPCEPTWMKRRHGFESQVGRQGGVLRPEWRLALSRRGSREALSGVQAWVGRWKQLDRRDRPTAIFLTDDSIIPAVMGAVEAAGARIPRDLSLITLTWHAAPKHGNRQLTHVKLDVASLARHAFQTAEKMAAEKRPLNSQPRTGRLALVPGFLVPGETVCAPAGVT